METQKVLARIASMLKISMGEKKENFKIYSFQIQDALLEYVTYEAKPGYFDVFEVEGDKITQVRESYLKVVDTKLTHLMQWNVNAQKYQIVFSGKDGTPFENSFLMRGPNNLGRLIVFYDRQILVDYSGVINSVDERGIHIGGERYLPYYEIPLTVCWWAAEKEEKATPAPRDGSKRKQKVYVPLWSKLLRIVSAFC